MHETARQFSKILRTNSFRFSCCALRLMLVIRIPVTLLFIIYGGLWTGVGHVLSVPMQEKEGSQWHCVNLWPGFSLTSSEFSTQAEKCSKWALHWSDSWVSCHTELQLACQSKAAPRSFLYLPPHIPPFLSTTFYLIIFCFKTQFPPFSICDPSILSDHLSHKTFPCCRLHTASQVVTLVVC